MEQQTKPEKPVARQKISLKDIESQFNEYAMDDSEIGVKMRAKLRSILKRAQHDDIHPDEEWVEIDVPVSVTGEPFKINEITYHGTCQVPMCVAQTLLHMIDMNRRVEQNRMREAGRIIDLDRPINNIRAIKQYEED